ncbi:MAG: hypothetical protein JXR25_10170 [Pontiellaceae bacterium]|nr:hypothetical protein [Pontiellaceae bacterium]
MNRQDGISQSWMACVMRSLSSEKDLSDDAKSALKQASSVHYEQLKMDEMLARYKGDLKGFIAFLEKQWGWKVTFDEQTRTLVADENKDCCVCPVIRHVPGIDTSALCHCSEGFAEKMFSAVSGKKAVARVTASVRRGDKSCGYTVVFES